MPTSQQAQVREFIQATFRSVWALELMCYLRDDRARGHSIAEMVAGMRSSELVIGQSVEALLAAGLIVVDAEGRAQFLPAGGELDQLAEGAQRLYATSPNAVRRMIVEAASSGVSAFADAFRMRKD